jgi:hypothetical protein
MAKKQLFIKANDRKNGLVNRSLQETPVNSFEYFKETVYRSPNSKWNKELEIKVEELFRVKEYDPIYELLLNDNGVVEKWARSFGKRYNLDWCELFSDYQLHLFNMLDGTKDKIYNINISFMHNLYKQLECHSKDKRKYYNAQKRKDNWNCVTKEIIETKPDPKDNYSDIEYITDLRNLTGISPDDKKILIGLATGTIDKKDIPQVLNWENVNNRMRLSRYMKHLREIIASNFSE